ncbi:MAG: T9SS type A sorting domain-containing protein [Fluviicola sp.]|nr:T9SS type A sorting domain-containing protein [Fluviicola sp.]
MNILRAILLLCALNLGSQLTAQELIGTAGGFSPTAQGSLSWSIGEIETETYTTVDGQFTTGYQQVYDSTLSVTKVNQEISLRVYPNPCQNTISIEAESLLGRCSVSIIDCQSKIVLEKTIYLESSKKEILDLTKLVKGYYFIKIRLIDSNNTIIQPIIKVF